MLFLLLERESLLAPCVTQTAGRRHKKKKKERESSGPSPRAASERLSAFAPQIHSEFYPDSDCCHDRNRARGGRDRTQRCPLFSTFPPSLCVSASVAAPTAQIDYPWWKIGRRRRERAGERERQLAQGRRRTQRERGQVVSVRRRGGGEHGDGSIFKNRAE